ncbi:MAG: DUF2851 family protein [Saprospiraceae bacterium]|nr:DUF2851 family protein [Saprospiraceae bacterium]MBK9222262.1 DUF2851 family protein [Saprospiraceae bacterium]
MKEDLIQFIWRSKVLLSNKLFTSNGSLIEVLHPGLFNTNQGPDFLFAKILLDGVLWAGHVEIHVKASDWNLHKHQLDPNYQNIILHVVWQHDIDIFYNQSPLACLELKDLVDPVLVRNYQGLMQNERSLACSPFLNYIPDSLKSIQLERMMIERLEDKTEKMKQELQLLQWDWEALLYRKLAHYMVAPMNSDAMAHLCEILTWKLLIKGYHDHTILEAMLFGTAGMLADDHQDAYYQGLQSEFKHLQLKYGIVPINAIEWKFLRLRPSHFPSLRIAQLAAFLYKEHQLFSKIIESDSLNEIYGYFDESPNEYWNSHFIFGKPSKEWKHAKIGTQTRDILIINVIVPILFAYGVIQNREELKEKALFFLQKLKTEKNHIVHMWKSYNFTLDHAGHSQGGIQLYQRYCNEKKCTSCLIGNEILKNPRT